MYFNYNYDCINTLVDMKLTKNFSKSEFGLKDSEIFFNAMLNPKAPNKELSKASNEFKVILS